MLKIIYTYCISTILLPAVFLIPSVICRACGYNLHTWEYFTDILVKRAFNAEYIIFGEKLIDKGIILANHMSMTDGGIDSVINESQSIYRFTYMASMLINGLITYIEDWGICIVRGKTSRHQLIHQIKDKLKKTNRVLLYPEGTRKSYYNRGAFTANLIKDNLKYGSLLSIYETLPTTKVQIVIGLNKDKVFTNIGRTKVPIIRSAPIIPSDYETVEEFIERIIEAFTESHNELYGENIYSRWA